MTTRAVVSSIPSTTAAVLSLSSEEFLTWLAVEQGRARNTVISYRRDLIVYEAFLAARHLQIEDVKMPDVEDYLSARRANGLAAASVARSLAAVRGLHRFRLEEGWAKSDPTADLTPPKLPRRLPKAISEDDVDRLLATVSAHDAISRRDRAILEVLYGTGMRVSELSGLSLSDLGSDTGLVRVLGKGDKERLVPMGSCATAALEDWLDDGGRP